MPPDSQRACIDIRYLLWGLSHKVALCSSPKVNPRVRSIREMPFSSRLGEGSTFYINLPRLSADRVRQLQAAQANPAMVEPVNSASSA